MTSKSEWRKALITRRKALTPDEVQRRSRGICEKAWAGRALWPVAHGGLAASYRPIHGEVDPGLLEGHLQNASWTLCYPRVDGKQLVFETAPGTEISIEKIQLWILPLVGVDTSMRRLGFGGGHYDRVWQGLGGQKSPALRWSLGLAYDFQWCEFGSEQHDWCMDAVASDRSS